MPHLLSEWRAHIQEVLGEYNAAKAAVIRLNDQVRADASILGIDSGVKGHLSRAQANLEGTYIVRMFAAFEAALRSYDRDLFDDQTRETNASVMIDQLGSKRRLRVRSTIIDGVHRVRKIRNYWAHDTDNEVELMTIDRVRGLLQAYLDRFPNSWE